MHKISPFWKNIFVFSVFSRMKKNFQKKIHGGISLKFSKILKKTKKTKFFEKIRKKHDFLKNWNFYFWTILKILVITPITSHHFWDDLKFAEKKGKKMTPKISKLKKTEKNEKNWKKLKKMSKSGHFWNLPRQFAQKNRQKWKKISKISKNLKKSQKKPFSKMTIN